MRKNTIKIGPINIISPVHNYNEKNWLTKEKDIEREINRAKLIDKKINFPDFLRKTGSTNLEEIKECSCSFPTKLYPIITSNGDVFPCIWLHEKQYIIGNLFKDNYSKIINSSKINYIKKIFNNGFYLEGCKGCIQEKIKLETLKMKTMINEEFISISAYTLKDSEYIYKLYKNPDLSKFYEKIELSLDNFKRLIEKKAFQKKAVLIKYKEKKIGIVEIKKISKKLSLCELEIIIDMKYQKLGLGSMALEYVEKYLYRKYQIKTFKLVVSKLNLSMISLAINCGYKLTNIIEAEWLLNNGIISDILVYKKNLKEKELGFKEIINKNSSILELKNLGEKYSLNLYSDLAYLNPSGSIKDIPVNNIIREKEVKGELDSINNFIAVSSGNLAISVAAHGARLKKSVDIFIPENTITKTKKNILKALGASIHITPKEKGFEGAEKQAILKMTSKSYNFDQFKNLGNPDSYKNKAKEIFYNFGRKIDCIILPLGSGGSITGIAKEYKKYNSNVKVYSVLPKSKDHFILGIGPDFIPKVLDVSLIEEHLKVSNKQAIDSTKELARIEGIYCGLSTGAIIGAIKGNIEKFQGKNIFTIFPESGDRYLSSTNLLNDKK